MTPEERKRLLFLKRMAYSHLTVLQIKEKTKTFIPNEEVPSLQAEYNELDKLIIEIDTKLIPIPNVQ